MARNSEKVSEHVTRVGEQGQRIGPAGRPPPGDHESRGRSAAIRRAWVGVPPGAGAVAVPS